MIIYTPLDLPKIEPDDWNVFWEIWNQHSSNLVKVLPNGSHSYSAVGRDDVWQGLDIYRYKNIDFTSAWRAPFYDIKEKLPKLYNMLDTLPMSNVTRVRLVSSKLEMTAHSDEVKDIWVARAYFHYTAPKEQWFFTRPNDGRGERTYITLPAETNWFAYNDKNCYHGTDYDPKYPKILLQVFSLSSIPQMLIDASIEKYKEHTIRYD